MASDTKFRSSLSTTESDFSKELKTGQLTAIEASPIEDVHPDGGLRAWLVVFGGACAMFSTFGYINSWGVFQGYYEATLLKGYSSSQIAWIGSAQYCLIFFPGIIVGKLFDLGFFHVPVFLASLVLVVATFLIAHCTEYWHFLLCQGIVIGLASAFLFAPSIGAISHWFQKKKGAALGFVAIGSSVGGVVFPILIRNLIQKIGFPWTMRVVGLVLIFSTACVNLTMRRRLPPHRGFTSIFNFKTFKEVPHYTTYCISSIFAFLGLYTTLIYIDLSSVHVGISPKFAFYLVAIANGAGGLGRYAGGALSDKLGAINTLVPLTFIAGILTYAWPFARDEASIVAIAILYGFASGAYVAALAAPIIAMGPVSEAGQRTGMAMTILSLGALAGPPISGAIFTATGGFECVGYFAGSAVIVACGLMLLTKRLAIGPSWIFKKY